MRVIYKKINFKSYLYSWSLLQYTIYFTFSYLSRLSFIYKKKIKYTEKNEKVKEDTNENKKERELWWGKTNYKKEIWHFYSFVTFHPELRYFGFGRHVNCSTNEAPQFSREWSGNPLANTECYILYNFPYYFSFLGLLWENRESTITIHS